MPDSRSLLRHTTRSGAEVVVLEWQGDRVLVRYVETGAVRSIPKESM